MNAFFSKHLGIILSALVTVAGWVWTTAITMSKVDDTAAHVERMDRDGTTMAQRGAWRVEMLEKEVTKLDVRLNSAVSDLNTIKSDVRVVVDWVEDQKRRTRIYENSALPKKELYQQAN